VVVIARCCTRYDNGMRMSPILTTLADRAGVELRVRERQR
jgi:hypothetical protein